MPVLAYVYGRSSYHTYDKQRMKNHKTQRWITYVDYNSFDYFCYPTLRLVRLIKCFCNPLSSSRMAPNVGYLEISNDGYPTLDEYAIILIH